MINKWRLFSCVAIRNSALPCNQVELAFTEDSRSALLVVEQDPQVQVMDNLSREKFSKHRIQLMVTMYDSQPRGTLVACTWQLLVGPSYPLQRTPVAKKTNDVLLCASFPLSCLLHTDSVLDLQLLGAPCCWFPQNPFVHTSKCAPSLVFEVLCWNSTLESGWSLGSTTTLWQTSLSKLAVMSHTSCVWALDYLVNYQMESNEYSNFCPSANATLPPFST